MQIICNDCYYRCMIPAVESVDVEFKQKHSNTYLKTVSAFANYGTGRIFFGVTDGGERIGVENPSELVIKIEQQINTVIEPRPRYELHQDAGVIVLTVHEGYDKPYQYQGKAYRRGGTSTVEVDRTELQNLFLQGANRTYDQLPAQRAELTFETLSEALMQKTAVQSFGEDTLKTLGLFTQNEGYNIAASLLADQNAMPGIDIVRFGADENEFNDRRSIAGTSVIEQYRFAVEYFTQFYMYEKIEGFDRKTYARIPQEAFREALANAIAHRDWPMPGAIRIAMYQDRIEITSPGGLPKGLTSDDYLNRFYSLPRNPLLANVFRLLGYIEALGTGIDRVRRAYKDVVQVPQFELTDTMIHINLPVISPIDDTEALVLSSLSGDAISRVEIEKRTGLKKATLIRALNTLESNGIIERVGAGPATRYRRR